MASIIGEIRSFAFGAGTIDGDDYSVSELRRSGWLECDGSSLPIPAFSKLFRAIGNNWGSEDRGNTFKIPDLRGFFMRGWDHGAGRDPDALAREGIHPADAPGDFVGAQGDKVGSVQDDEFQQHKHTFNGAIHYSAGAGDHPRAKPTGHTRDTSSVGGNETRPKNAFVMFCIYSGRRIPHGADISSLEPESEQ